MTPSILATRDLSKRFGRQVALDGLSVSVPRGSICGLIGPNGAGKTTAFGVIAGLVRPDAGEVDLFGEGRFDPAAHAGRLGLLPQDGEFSRDTTVHALLVYYARLGGLSRRAAIAATDEVLEQVQLEDRRGARVQQLSHGMRRRLQVAQALLGDPELVLLDEPMSGLDPELIVRMRELLVRKRATSTLVVSSHNLQELEVICDDVIFIEAGRCTRQGPIADVTGRGVFMRYHLEELVDVAALKRACPEFELTWQETTLVVQAHPGLTPAHVNQRVLRALLDVNARVVEVRAGRSLEAAYLDSRTA